MLREHGCSGAMAPSSCYSEELQVWVPESGQAYTLTPLGVRWGVHGQEGGSLLPFLREIGLVFAPSPLRARGLELSFRAEDCTKAFVQNVGGKEVSVYAHSFWLPLTLFPEESQAWKEPLCM